MTQDDEEFEKTKGAEGRGIWYKSDLSGIKFEKETLDDY